MGVGGGGLFFVSFCLVFWKKGKLGGWDLTIVVARGKPLTPFANSDPRTNPVVSSAKPGANAGEDSPHPSPHPRGRGKRRATRRTAFCIDWATVIVSSSRHSSIFLFIFFLPSFETVTLSVNRDNTLLQWLKHLSHKLTIKRKRKQEKTIFKCHWN